MQAVMSNFKDFSRRKEWLGALLLKPTGYKFEPPGLILEVSKMMLFFMKERASNIL